MRPAEIIRIKRDGQPLGTEQIQAFVQGLVDGRWSEGPVAAMAMAIWLRGMNRDETVALTRAMTHSGQVLNWAGSGLSGPVLDKHSTGGVGDKVSLVLAPIVAACGGVVPMISGRGLGHTGGTLDKLQALPGYQVTPSPEQLLRSLRQAGCAIIGQTDQLAPADRRLYAVRDVTATIESVPLITASILSKKLAAGLQGLVMDVKLGNGAFTPSLPAARELATSLVQVAQGAGLPCKALITDMNQVLGHTAGNALEVAECLAFLSDQNQETRLLALTLTLAGHMLHLGQLASSPEAGRQQAQQALQSGRAAEHFARMVASLGGPADVFAQPGLATAPVVRDVPAPTTGWITHQDTRALGLAVVALGGGRNLATDPIDPRVGFSHILPVGSRVQAGEPLLRVHAASEVAAQFASLDVLRAIRLSAEAPDELALVVEVL